MKRTATLLFSLTLATAGCGGGEPLAAPVDPTGGWDLVSGTVNGQAITPIVGHPITIEFEDGRAGGNSACNGYGGDYTLDGSTISFSEIAMTEMACFPQEVMTLESQYVSALVEVETMSKDGSNLLLTGNGVDLEFEPVEPTPTADMLGTVWVLDGLINRDNVTSVAGERATLEFFSDGSILASTGCRNLAGTYVETATGIKMTSMTTAGECPEDLSQQDNIVVSVLEGEYRVVIDEQTMTLTGPGNEGLVYRAET